MSGIIETIKEQLEGSSDAVFQSIRLHGHSCHLIYIPFIVNSLSLHKDIALPLRNEANSEHKWSDF